jgi:hypothetical protein
MAASKMAAALFRRPGKVPAAALFGRREKQWPAMGACCSGHCFPDGVK